MPKICCVWFLLSLLTLTCEGKFETWVGECEHFYFSLLKELPDNLMNSLQSVKEAEGDKLLEQNN